VSINPDLLVKLDDDWVKTSDMVFRYAYWSGPIVPPEFTVATPV
jgi:hypothetical protein